MLDKDPLDISVIIRCSDDENVFRCIESIDENVEVIVSLTENEIIQQKLEEIGVEYVLSPKGNLSITSNVGFMQAKYNKTIITDSDTIFEKGCIKKMHSALKKYPIARAKLIFQSFPRNLRSRIAAKARDFLYNKPLVFTPGIGIRKDVISKINGFLFNDPVPWAVDADLNFRIKESKLPVCFLKDGCLYHLPLNFKHDLKAAFRIGTGVRISVKVLSKIFGNPRRIKKSLKAVKKRDYFNLLKEKSLLVFAYQFIWDFFYYYGYYYQNFLLKYKIRTGIKTNAKG